MNSSMVWQNISIQVSIKFKILSKISIKETINVCISGIKSSASAEIYIKTNGFVEKLGDILYIVVAEVTPLIWVVPKCFGSIFFYFTTNLGNDALELPLPSWWVCKIKLDSFKYVFEIVAILRIPFDWKTPIGYLTAVVYQYVMTRFSFVFIAGAVSIGISEFLFAVTVTDDIKCILESFNKDAKSKNTRLKTLQHLSNYIQIHSTLKQLSCDSLINLSMIHNFYVSGLYSFLDLFRISSKFFSQCLWPFSHGASSQFAEQC